MEVIWLVRSSRYLLSMLNLGNFGHNLRIKEPRVPTECENKSGFGVPLPTSCPAWRKNRWAINNQYKRKVRDDLA
jgi:hypothetical protein